MAMYDRIELFCQAILDQGREEAERLLSQARERSGAMVDLAEKERQTVLQRAQAELQAQALREARAVLDRAQLESKRRLAQAKGEILTELVQEARRRLLAFRESPDYPPWLGGERFLVSVHPEETRWLDVRLLEAVSRETGAHLEVSTDPDLPAGGFVLGVADQRMRLDQTFTGLLRRREELLRTQLARRLWES
jgi:vacuolar-type H+-ATPase subunit E/Vma4